MTIHGFSRPRGAGLSTLGRGRAASQPAGLDRPPAGAARAPTGLRGGRVSSEPAESVELRCAATQPGPHEAQRLGIRTRVLASRAFGAGVLALLLVSASAWRVPGPRPVAHLLFVAGLAAAVVGFLGRLWALVFIGGRKKSSLVVAGPDALCRHPLYLFSLIGDLGLGLCAERFAVVALFLGAALLILPGAMRREERFLEERFVDYGDYQRRVPALLPRWSSRPSNDGVYVEARAMRRALVESGGFLVAPALIEFLARLQAAETLPYLFRLP